MTLNWIPVVSISLTSKVQAYNGSPSSANSDIGTWTEAMDSDSAFAAATGIFTAPRNGIYLCQFVATINGGGATATSIKTSIQIDGVDVDLEQVGRSGFTGSIQSTIMNVWLASLTVGQTLRIHYLNEDTAPAVSSISNTELTILAVL